MERPKRCPPSQVIQNRSKGDSIRDGAEGGRPPKTKEQGQTVREAVAHFQKAASGTHAKLTADWIAEVFGNLKTSSLKTEHVDLMNQWAKRFARSTCHKRAMAIRQQLRYMAQRHGSDYRLVEDVIRPPKPKPRNVTATPAERNAIIAGAWPALRCWLLMCSDLAIRSGTAAKLGPQHYDRERRTLTFTTKYGAIVKLPVTAELAELLDQCTDHSLPFASQLPGRRRNQSSTWDTAPLGHDCNAVCLNAAYRRVKERAGISRKLTPHDLRRTTARSVYKATHDLTVVQALLGHSDLTSTLWYLQDVLTEVPTATLELAKLNPTTEVIQ